MLNIIHIYNIIHIILSMFRKVVNIIIHILKMSVLNKNKLIFNMFYVIYILNENIF